MLRVTLAVCLLCAVLGIAQAEPNAPATYSYQMPKEAKGPTINGQSKTKTYGTKNSPLIVVILNPEPPQEEREWETKERDEKAILDRKLVEYTGDLARY